MRQQHSGNPNHGDNLERWQAWRAGRIKQLATEHGWLSVVGLDWLNTPDVEAIPHPIGGFPGLWQGDGLSVRAQFSADDDVLQDGKPISGEVVVDLRQGDDFSLTHGSVRAEVLARGGLVGVRYRDSSSPLRTKFDVVPAFDYDPAWVIDASYRRLAQPVVVPVATADPLVTETETMTGVLSFELAGQHYQLRTSGEDANATLIFHDLTNGVSTALWRFVVARVFPHGGASIDFNRAMNFPFAFTPGACTCTQPLVEASLNVAVEAGERRPI